MDDYENLKFIKLLDYKIIRSQEEEEVNLHVELRKEYNRYKCSNRETYYFDQRIIYEYLSEDDSEFRKKQNKDKLISQNNDE